MPNATQSCSARQRAANRLPTELAILLTIAMHVALFYGFRMRQVAPGSELASRHEPRTVLLSPPTGGHRWEQDLHAWSRIADPTLLSLPNERYGFSRIRRDERERPVSPPPAYPFPTKPIAERDLPLIHLAHLPDSLGDTIRRNWALPNPTLPPPPEPAVLPEGVIWRLADGTPLARQPEVPLESLAQRLSEEPADRPTQIDLSRPGQRLRVRVRHSCGNAALDIAAVKALAGELRHCELSDTPDQAPTYLPAGTETVQIEVEWRRVPTAPVELQEN